MPGIQIANTRPNTKEAKLATKAYTPGFQPGTLSDYAAQIECI